jgi:hypothetical protein
MPHGRTSTPVNARQSDDEHPQEVPLSSFTS